MNQAELLRRAADRLIAAITALAVRPVRLMEVCGTHTVAICKAGIRGLLPPQVELISGPGCPVCVTANEYLDTAIAYSRQPQVIVASFGDMLRVPGSSTSLLAQRAEGADIRIVYSPLEALTMARDNPTRQVVFLAVGFETTVPAVAATVLAAAEAGVDNFFLLTAHKLVPPALAALAAASDVQVDGFLCPGHVSAIIGTEPYKFLARDYHMPCVVAGFEPLDILQAVYMLLRQIHDGRAAVENQYRRAVRPTGNAAALALMHRVFAPADAAWRGMGVIPGTGLVLAEPYRRFDAREQLPVVVEPSRAAPGCRCGEVLRGVIRPPACALFGRACAPEHPVGPCMVSVEGTCAAYYKYGSGRWQI